jgi:hypothetical protein
MKAFNINCRIDEKYRDVVAFIKLKRGGLTEFVEAALQKELEKMSPETIEILQNVRKLVGK